MSQAQALVLLKDGIAAAKAGNKVQARQLLRQAVERDARSEAAWLWLAGLAEAPLEAVHFLERVLALNPGHEKAQVAVRAARLQAGVAAAKAQDKVQARTLLRKAVEHDPGNEMAWLWLASVAENADEAIRHLDRVLQLNPANERARAGLERYRAHKAAPRGASEPPATRAGEPPAPPVVARFPDRATPEVARSGDRATTASAPRAPAASPSVEFRKDLAADEQKTQARPAVPRKTEEPRDVLETPPPAARSILDDSIHISSSAQTDTTVELVEETWECPFCQAEAPEPLERCQDCGSLLTLNHVENFFKPLNVDQEKVNAAIERLEQVDPATDFATAYQLGLAYLNLKQFDAAVDLLQTAVDLVPDDEALVRQVDNLVNYRLSVTQVRDRGKRKTILIVDDSPTIRKLVTMTVERRGFAARTAADSYEAVDVIRDQGVPDLILLDIAMPGMDGYQLCRLLRQNADTANVPIIMLSGKDGFFSKVRGRMAGSTEYITKPFEPEALLRAVERYCVPSGSSAVPAGRKK